MENAGPGGDCRATKVVGRLPSSESVRRIVVYHIGSLGDTLATVPALHVVRDTFPRSHITLLSDRQVGRNYILPAHVLAGSGLVDAFQTYTVHSGPTARWRNLLSKIPLWVWLRRRRFDALVYLVHLHGANSQRVSRDLRFFRAAGVRVIWGADTWFRWPDMGAPRPLPRVPHMADLLLERLKHSGFDVPSPGNGNTRVPLAEVDRRRVAEWLPAERLDDGKPWIGICPGSKMPSKVWPRDRFERVVRELVREFDAWPVVVGGTDEVDTARSLVAAWRRGYVAAGALDVRATIAVLERCSLYLGNDTGAMHMAASVGTPCVAVFSARDVPGAWFPYGPRHRVFRSEIDCEGCMLVQCVERDNQCLKEITEDQVLEACRHLLREGATAG